MSPKETLVNLFGYTPAEADLTIAEMEMTFGPFPTPENIAAAREAACAAETARQTEEATIAPRSFTITVNGQQGAGKSTLLIVILKALVDAGLISDLTDVMDSYENPLRLLERVRSMDSNGEAIDIKIAGRDISDVQDTLANGGSIFGEPATLDDFLRGSTGIAVCERTATRDEVVTYGVQGILQSMVDDAFESVVVDAGAKEVIFRVKLG